MPIAPSPWPLIRNMRTYVSGRIDTRSGLALISAAGSDPVHSIKRLNNDIASLAVKNSRVVGAGTKVYTQVSLAGSLVVIDTGYSGDPLCMFQMRPPDSAEAWLYIANSLKMSKVRADGTVFSMGSPPPLFAPQVTFALDALQIIDDTSAIGSWTNGGTAGPITVQTRFNSASITALIYDSQQVASGYGAFSPGPGMCSMVVPGLNSFVRPGMILSLPVGPEDAVVREILPGSSPTVGSASAFAPSQPLLGTRIQVLTIHLTNGAIDPTYYGYDPSMDNAARFKQRTSVNAKDPPEPNPPIVRSSPGSVSLGLRVGSIVALPSIPSGSTTYSQIVAVNRGPDGSVSLTVNNYFTSLTLKNFAATPSAGQVITILPTIRINTVNQQVAAVVPVISKALSSSVTIGTGFLQELVPFDFSHVNVGGVSPIHRPSQSDDYIHVSIQMDHPELLVEGRVIFDVDGTTNDFAHNYFFKAFRSSDLQQAVLSNETILSSREQNLNTSVIDTFGGRGSPVSNSRQVGPVKDIGGPGRIPVREPLPVRFGPGGTIPVSDQVATGTSQWTELKFKISDLMRVGEDSSKTLANVQGIRIQFNVNAQVQIQIGSLWIGGSYGPDVGTTGSPYFYRYRGRSSLTGTKTNPSPAVRNGIEPRRHGVLISMNPLPDPQLDLLDVFRWGGSLTNWVFVGSCSNVTGSQQVTDTYQDLDLATAEQLEFDNFQPFPTLDTPKRGVVNAIGTKVTWVSGDQFNTQWSPGTQINIGGVWYTLYSQPADATDLEAVENLGTQTNVPYLIKQATILGQAMPAMWGPYSMASALFNFACGDNFQPGVLFLTKGNNADSAPDILQIEVTSPSEPLMNGCIYNGLPYVWSCARLFILYPSFQGGFLLTGGGVLPASGTNLFTPQDVQGNKGLFARWFFCGGPGIPKMWYGAEDGIYETAGGAGSSITDEQLYLLFPHDGQPAQPVTIGTVTIQPPDFTQTSRLRLSYADGFLYFDYVDVNGNSATLVYNTIEKVWGLDIYNLGTPNGVITHYLEEGRGVHSLLAGGSDFNLYQMSGVADNGNSFVSDFRSPQDGSGDGYMHIRDGDFGLESANLVSTLLSLVINVDGVDTVIFLPTSPTGAYKKTYAALPALKGKIFSWGISNNNQNTPSPFTIFRKDCMVRMKSWANSSSYDKKSPFGRGRIPQGV